MYNNGNSSKNVTGASVVDGTIANADIDSSAAIATSKLSGAVTSITSHGLSSSATTDTTDASNIGSGTLPNARLSAVPTSSLTGAVTSIASHGLASSATTDTTNASNIGSGTLSNDRLSLDISNSDVNASAEIAQSKLATLAITDSEVADNALSGNKIDGGTISNFASTGIDDNASSTALTLLSNGYIEATNGRVISTMTSCGNVSTTATEVTPIGATYGGIAIVFGNSGGNMFSDIVSFSLSQTDVLSQQSVSGGPAGRTYTAAGGHLKLAMASGTYACQYSDFTNSSDAS